MIEEVFQSLLVKYLGLKDFSSQMVAVYDKKYYQSEVNSNEETAWLLKLTQYRESEKIYGEICDVLHDLLGLVSED